MRTVTVKECSEILEHKYLGFLYCFEVGNGNIKIGQTSNLKIRIKSHQDKMVSIGSSIKEIFISKPHINYQENEVELFEILQKYRVSGAEVFSCSTDDVIEAFNKLSYDSDVESREKHFKDESINNHKQAELLFTAFSKAVDKVRELKNPLIDYGKKDMCDPCVRLAREKLHEDVGYIDNMNSLIDFSMNKTYFDWIERLCKDRIDTGKLHFLIAENCRGSFGAYFELTIEWLLKYPKGDIEEYESFIINNSPR